MTRRRRGVRYNHGNPPGWRPPPGEWYHGDETDRRAGRVRQGSRWDARRRRRRGPPLARWMWEAFGVVAGWVAVAGAARLGVAGPPGSKIPALIGGLAVVGAPGSAWAYADWKRKRDPAGLAPAELALAWGVPGALAALAYRLGTGPGQRWLLACWAGWWLAAWFWVRVVRPPERRAAGYARTARRAEVRRTRPPRPLPLAAAARRCWSASVAGAAWVARAPEDPDLDPGDGDGRAWSPAVPRERRVPAYAVARGDEDDGDWRPARRTSVPSRRPSERDPAPVPQPRPPLEDQAREPAAAPDPVAALAARLRVGPAGLKAVADLVARPGTVTTGTEAAGALGMHRATAARWLAALADAGLAERVGDGRGGRGSGFRAPSGQLGITGLASAIRRNRTTCMYPFRAQRPRRA